MCEDLSRLWKMFWKAERFVETYSYAYRFGLHKENVIKFDKIDFQVKSHLIVTDVGKSLHCNQRWIRTWKRMKRNVIRSAAAFAAPAIRRWSRFDFTNELIRTKIRFCAQFRNASKVFALRFIENVTLNSVTAVVTTSIRMGPMLNSFTAVTTSIRMGPMIRVRIWRRRSNARKSWKFRRPAFNWKF